MADYATPLASLRRLRAVLALRGTTLSSLAKKIGCTPSHLRVVVLGRRAVSPALRTKLEREVRPDEWRFALGEADVLRDVSDDTSPSDVEEIAAGPGDAPASATLVALGAPITSAAIGGADMHDGLIESAPARARRGRDHLEPPARRKHDEA
ncbi:MAG TPA: helix-turn-helix transcriptional regulator [Kofleriaceae bacterium]|nr:helix-turn-helix transcriptional regulator [Kofleriaceae bacterium]